MRNLKGIKMGIKGRGSVVLSLLFFSLLAGALLVSLSLASVSTLVITPQRPVQGEIVTITGTASPSEEVPITISFEQVLSVTGGNYQWELSSVEIPAGRNQFTVTARVVNNLIVTLVFWGIPITRKVDAANGVAMISQSDVPAGTYDVLISGSSNSNAARISVEAKTFLTADAKNGNFAYSYNTRSIPPGQFVVSVGGITKTIELRAPAPTPSSTGGTGGGGLPTPSSPAPSVSPTPSPSPPVSPTPTPASTATPQPTPIKNHTGTASPIPPHSMMPSPETTKPSRIPGFELIGGLVALIIISMFKGITKGR